jgi:EamA domain-containing membrane protein RarD
MKTKISSLAPIVAVSFLFAFSANKKIQVDSGTSLVLETDFSASKKKHQPFELVF